MKRRSSVLRRGTRAVGVAALLAAGLAAGGGWPATAADSTWCGPTGGFTHCRVFAFTGAAENFAVPLGVEQLDVRAWGEGGDGNPFANGGAGAYVAGTLDVTPGEQLTVRVGGYYYGESYGDALGGQPSGTWGEKGGASSAVRTADGSALVVAAGGGGGGLGVTGHGRAGGGGAPDGQDAIEEALGGRGAHGAQGGAAGGAGGEAGADATQGGAGGDSTDGGGGGGAGYAGGGSGAGKTAAGHGGSGGGGSSYAAAERVTDVRMLSSDSTVPPAKDDPFWVSSPFNDPVLSGVAEGGPNGPGGDGRVVFQWQDPKGIPLVTELTRESGDDQTVLPLFFSDPMVVLARDKDGEPVAGQKVTFALEDPEALKVKWDDEGLTEVYTDDQGRAASPAVLTGEAAGAFSVRATSGAASTAFTAHVGRTSHALTITGGDEQRAEPGTAFAESLAVRVTKDGAPAVDTEVTFAVEGDAEDAPVFADGAGTVLATTDADGRATAAELIAGQTPGVYTVLASAGGTTIRFTVEVTEKQAADSPSPSTSETSSTAPTDSDGSGGTSAPGGSGSLASTGAADLGTLAAAALALAALGWAATRFGRRARTRSHAQGLT
ncbi:glycine-rich protein [Streptomyces sp. JW3]|uniref:glycine-rich protein n=1 Tax=Streptomyces sp. JW3 TaxID=3456955 RepID=UPI003FA45F16